MFGGLFKRKPKPQKRDPLVTENAFGVFTMEYLDRYNAEPAYAYLGCVRWDAPSGAAEVEAEVPCDTAPGGERPFSADKGFKLLGKLLSGSRELDRRVKRCVLDEFTDSESGAVEIWGSSEDFPDGGGEITPEEFVGRLEVCSLYIQEDGSVFFIVGLDGMFTDHAAGVTLMPDGSLTDCKLIG